MSVQASSGGFPEPTASEDLTCSAGDYAVQVRGVGYAGPSEASVPRREWSNVSKFGGLHPPGRAQRALLHPIRAVVVADGVGGGRRHDASGPTFTLQVADRVAGRRHGHGSGPTFTSSPYGLVVCEGGAA